MASEDFLSQGIIYGRGEDDSTYSCALWPTSGIRGLDLCHAHLSGGCHLKRGWEPGSARLHPGFHLEVGLRIHPRDAVHPGDYPEAFQI